MRSRLGIAVLMLGLALASACGKNKSHETSGPPPEVTGLAAVPATAQVIIGANVAKLGLLFGLLLQRPRRLLVDVLVGPIGERHDGAHRARKVAALVSLGDFVPGRDGGRE